jgi:hypothetical protein
MDRTLQGYSLEEGHTMCVPLTQFIGWGLIGGLAGTLVMDLVLMGALLAVGLPAFTCFSIVGDTVANFFSALDMKFPGGSPTGAATHYIVGPLLGAFFGAVMARHTAFRVDTLKKTVIRAVLFIEILSQPLLLTTPILLKMAALDTVKWYGGSFVMHLIAGIVMGAIVGYGLRLQIAGGHQSFHNHQLPLQKGLML